MEKLVELQSKHGVGSSKTLLLNGNQNINDPYNLAEDTNAIKRKMQDDSDDDGEAKNSFLNIYDENKNKTSNEGEKDTKLKEVKVTQDEEQNNQKDKPVIQELSSQSFDGKNDSKNQKYEEQVQRSPLIPKFEWEKAEKVDAQFQFIN